MSKLVTNLSEFTYKSLKFTPLRKFKPHEDFHHVSKKLDSINISNRIDFKPQYIDRNLYKIYDWNYEAFYRAAKKADAANGEIDIFMLDGKQVVPCNEQLFGYDN